MGLISQSKIGKIQFFQSKVAPWTTNAVAIGTSAAEVTAMEAKLTAAQDAMNDQIAAYAAAETATNALDNAIDALMNAGTDIIKQIRTKAAIVGGDSVYNLAEIPPRALPSPKPAPGKPTDFGATIEDNGALKLKWKCNNPAGATGTLYQVYRKAEGESDYTYIGGTGEKKLTDETVPAGAAQLMYQIQAVRSTAVGPWATFVVTIGTVAGGAMSASVTQASPKLAA